MRRTGRFALAFSKMDEGIGGTGGIDTVNCCGGGGERARARAASELEDVRRCKRLCDALRGVLGAERDAKRGVPRDEGAERDEGEEEAAGERGERKASGAGRGW